MVPITSHHINCTGSAGLRRGGVQLGGCSIGVSGSGSATQLRGGASGSLSCQNQGKEEPEPTEPTKPTCGIPGDGYTYEIEAKRTLNVMGTGDPVTSMEILVEPEQNITYKRSIGPENPLMISGWIYQNKHLYFFNDEDNLLNTCANTENDDIWACVMIEVAKNSVMPGGTCAVKKGTYTISENANPVSVTLPEKIKCGKYDLIFEGYVAPNEEDLLNDPDEKWTLAYLEYYTFQIPDNGNCTKPAKKAKSG